MAQSRDSVRASFRRDLIQRLFAVAISVGMASTLSAINWIKDGHSPSLQEYQQLSILIVALATTVLSWDYYLVAVSNRPLFGLARFSVDILLVFLYLLLLLTSKHLTWWLPLLSIIFGMYALWDFLTLIEHRSAYTQNEAESEKQSVFWIYIHGVLGNGSVNHEPVITLIWWACISSLVYINWGNLANHVIIISIIVLITLFVYRCDQIGKISLKYRLFAIVLIIGIDCAYQSFGTEFDDSKLLLFT